VSLALSTIPACDSPRTPCFLAEPALPWLPAHYRVELEVEYRATAILELVRRGDDLSARLRTRDTAPPLPPGTLFEGAGRIERFPEADLDLVATTFPVEDPGGSLCDTEPLSLALSLPVPRGTCEATGALTLFCGSPLPTDRTLEVQRVSGSIELALPALP
jgi:hypothetical protein